MVGHHSDRGCQVFIFGEPEDVEKARDWIKSWIGPIDMVEARGFAGWKETREVKERESRRRPEESLLARKEREYGERDAARRGIKRGEIDEVAGKWSRVVRSQVPPRVNPAISPPLQPLETLEDLRAKLDKRRKQNKQETVRDVRGTSRGKPLVRLSRELRLVKTPEVNSGSPMRFGRSVEEDMAGRDDARRSSGGMRRDRSKSTGRLMPEKTPRELRSKSTSRLKVERGRSQPASHHEAAEQRRITRSMSAARDLGRNGEGEGASAKIQGKGRRNLIREERDSKSRWGSSWRQSEGRGVDTQQHEETAPERMRSISTGRIPLDGRRSISSTRVGIGARRVRRIAKQCNYGNFPH